MMKKKLLFFAALAVIMSMALSAPLFAIADGNATNPMPLGAWLMTEGEGTAISDNAGTADGTAACRDNSELTGVWVDDDLFGSVMAAGNCVEISSADYDLTGSFTLTGWVNVSNDHTGYTYVMQAGDATSALFNIHINNGGGLVMESGAWGRGYEISAVKGAGWTFFAFVYNAAEDKIASFKNDGVAMSPEAQTGKMGTSVSHLVLGALLDKGAPVDGNIADFRVYGSNLSDDEVNAVYDEVMNPAPDYAAPVTGWDLTDGSGNAGANVVGTRANAVLHYNGDNAEWIDDDLFGKVLAKNQYAEATESIDLTGSFTLSGWVKIDSEGSYPRIMSGLGATWNIHINALGKLVMEDYTTGSWGRGYELSPAVVGNGWQNFAFVINAAAQSVTGYLNGEISMTAETLAGLFKSVNTGVVIGAYGDGGGRPDGNIAKVMIYDRVLASSELKDLYEQIIPAVDSIGVVGKWSITDGTGTTAADSADKETTFNGTVVSGKTGVTAGTWIDDPDEVFEKILAEGQGVKLDKAVNLSKNFSISGWVNVKEDFTEYCVVAHGASATDENKWTIFVNGGGKLVMEIGNYPNSSAYELGEVAGNGWTMFTFIFNNVTEKISGYLNKEVVGSQSMVNRLGGSNTGLMLGGYYDNAGNPVSGNIAHFYITDTVLTYSDVEALYEEVIPFVLPEIPTYGKLAQWNLYKKDNADKSQFSRITVPSGDVTYAADSKFVEVIDFDGTQRLDVAGSALIAKEFTIAGFINIAEGAIPEGSYFHVISNGSKDKADYWEISINSAGKLSFWSPMYSRGLDSGMRVDTGNWVFFAVVFKDSAMSIYIDSSRVASGVEVILNKVYPTEPVSDFMTIGGYNKEASFIGRIASISIYDEVLTEQKIGELKNIIVKADEKPNPDPDPDPTDDTKKGCGSGVSANFPAIALLVAILGAALLIAGRKQTSEKKR